MTHAAALSVLVLAALVQPAPAQNFNSPRAQRDLSAGVSVTPSAPLTTSVLPPTWGTLGGTVGTIPSAPSPGTLGQTLGATIPAPPSVVAPR